MTTVSLKSLVLALAGMLVAASVAPASDKFPWTDDSAAALGEYLAIREVAEAPGPGSLALAVLASSVKPASVTEVNVGASDSRFPRPLLATAFRDSWEQQLRWQDRTLRLSQRQTMSYIGQVHAHNLQSPMVAMDPGSFVRVWGLTTARTGLTLGGRSVLLGFDVMGMGGGGRTSVARAGVRGLEGVIDAKLNKIPGGPLITGQFSPGDRMIGNIEFGVGLGRLTVDTYNRFTPPFTTTSVQLGPNTLREPSGQLYWPINQVRSTTWSVDWPGIGMDNSRMAMGTALTDGLAGPAYQHMVMPTMGSYSGTHIAGSRVTGSQWSSPSSITGFDSTKIVITQGISTDRAFVGGRMSGFDPTRDTIQTTVIQVSELREIVGRPTLNNSWNTGLDFSRSTNVGMLHSPALGPNTLLGMPIQNYPMMPTQSYQMPIFQSYPMMPTPSYQMPSQSYQTPIVPSLSGIR